MTDPVPYDAFAEIYDAWAESAPITRENQEFYVKRLVEAEGPAVELGVGNGRICVEAAKRGKAVIGVDSSEKILDLCESRARSAGVIDRVTLIKGDFRDFELPEPAALITIPFHSIGHLIKEEDKRRALATIPRAAAVRRLFHLRPFHLSRWRPAPRRPRTNGIAMPRPAISMRVLRFGWSARALVKSWSKPACPVTPGCHIFFHGLRSTARCRRPHANFLQM